MLYCNPPLSQSTRWGGINSQFIGVKKERKKNVILFLLLDLMFELHFVEYVMSLTHSSAQSFCSHLKSGLNTWAIRQIQA